ncbi:MAG: response regulator transcription factor, partial [Oscillospiraceae bacterium]|nr:response regulator transcription factor [Oscillospiraceae bacterium]
LVRCCGNIEIDPSQSLVLQDGKEIQLTDIEYRILYLLASHPRKIFSAQNIYESVWEEPYFYTSNNLVMVHIRNIRRKLGDDPQNCHTIRTVWGKGYRIE